MVKSYNDDQKYFLNWMETYAPYVLPLFDLETGSYFYERADKFLAVASNGEAIMTRFALGVWGGNNPYNFDVIEAAKELDTPEYEAILSFLNNPRWP